MYEKYVKRGLDVFLSTLGLLILSWLYLLLAVIIFVDDPGPVIFRQKRIGIRKTEFICYKLRTMRRDTPHETPTHMLRNPEVYITNVGKFLRKYSLDELPQLWNIWKGDMSIVGPRPERPEIARQYEAEMPEFQYRLRVKAGLTGYAQIFGKYNTTPYDKLKLDLYYIQNYSLMLDVKLMVQTVKILFMKESTQGIAAGQTTATLQICRNINGEE